MHLTLLTLAIVGYVAATGLALAYLVQRDELLHRLAALATLAAWILHTGALLALAIDLGRPPLGSLPDAVSVAVWVVVLLEMWLERRYGLSGLGAFVLPVALALSLQSTAIRPLIGPALSGAWVWVHIGLALVGIAAFVFNFAGALMYLLQERQLRCQAPGRPVLLAAGAGDPRPAHLSHARARFSVPDHGAAPGRPVGRSRLGQRLRLRSPGAPLLRRLGGLRRNPRGTRASAAGTGGAPRTSRSWDSPRSRSRWSAGLFLPGKHGG